MCHNSQFCLTFCMELSSLVLKFSWILWPLHEIKNPSLVSEYYGCISLGKFKIGFLNSKRITVHQRNHRLLAQSGLFGSLMHNDLSRLGYLCLVEKSSQFFYLRIQSWLFTKKYTLCLCLRWLWLACQILSISWAMWFFGENTV